MGLAANPAEPTFVNAMAKNPAEPPLLLRALDKYAAEPPFVRALAKNPAEPPLLLHAMDKNAAEPPLVLCGLAKNPAAPPLLLALRRAAQVLQRRPLRRASQDHRSLRRSRTALTALPPAQP